jgi:hypothetical protein
MKTSKEIHIWRRRGRERREKSGVLMTRTGTKWLRADIVFLKRHYGPIDPRVSKLFQFYRFLSTYSCQAFK